MQSKVNIDWVREKDKLRIIDLENGDYFRWPGYEGQLYFRIKSYNLDGWIALSSANNGLNRDTMDSEIIRVNVDMKIKDAF